MKNLFDYVYYKLTKAYVKWDKNRGITAICALALMQTFLIVDLFYVPLRLIYPPSTFAEYFSYIKYSIVGLILILFLINDWYYKDKYDELKERFANESFRVLKTVLVFVIVLLPAVIFLLSAAILRPL